MGIFNIEVTEILQRTIQVEADDLETAISNVKERYKSEEIVLDSGDYVATDIRAL